jgi:hypothetical protein
MKILSLYSANPSPAQESSTSTRKKIVAAIAILTACGLGLWVGVQMALRLSSGHT